MTDAPVHYARPKRSFLDPQGQNEGFQKSHIVKTAFRILRLELNTRAGVAPEEIESYSNIDFRRQHRRELEQPRVAESTNALQRFRRLVTASFL